MSLSTEPRHSSPWLRGLSVVGALLALMWALEIYDQLTLNSLDPLGIFPRDPSRLWHLLVAPWLHFGWAHLVANSVPFLVLGLLTFLSGLVRFVTTTLVSALSSSLLVWLIAPSGSITAGVSGVVFGYLTYLLVRGIYTRRIGHIVLAVAVFALYGSILLGVIPGTSGVSWQGHLGGAIGGILAARWAYTHRAGSSGGD